MRPEEGTSRFYIADDSVVGATPKMEGSSWFVSKELKPVQGIDMFQWVPTEEPQFLLRELDVASLDALKREIVIPAGVEYSASQKYQLMIAERIRNYLSP